MDYKDMGNTLETSAKNPQNPKPVSPNPINAINLPKPIKPICKPYIGPINPIEPYKPYEPLQTLRSSVEPKPQHPPSAGSPPAARMAPRRALRMAATAPAWAEDG